MKLIRILLFILFLSAGIMPSHAIKIGIINDVPFTYIGTSTEGYIIDARTNKSVYRIVQMHPYRFRAQNNSVTIEMGAQQYDLGSNFIIIRPTNRGLSCAKKHWYRGEILLKASAGNLTVINNINLEDYLKGVVPSEMPSKWNIEAQKAQAIAARSYAIANLGKRTARGYDLKDTPEDQVYGGASRETVQTNKACDDTRGIVITYNQKVIPAYYSASAGGHTVNSGDLWYKDLPYLRSVPSFDEGVKKNGHGIGMSQHGANNLAAKGYNAYQILTYFYNNVKFGRLNPSWPI